MYNSQSPYTDSFNIFLTSITIMLKVFECFMKFLFNFFSCPKVWRIIDFVASSAVCIQYSTVPYRLHHQVQCVYSTVQYRTDCIVKCSVYSTVQYSTVQAASSSAVCIQYSVVPYRLHLTDLTSNVRWIKFLIQWFMHFLYTFSKQCNFW